MVRYQGDFVTSNSAMYYFLYESANNWWPNKFLTCTSEMKDWAAFLGTRKNIFYSLFETFSPTLMSIKSISIHLRLYISRICRYQTFAHRQNNVGYFNWAHAGKGRKTVELVCRCSKGWADIWSLCTSVFLFVKTIEPMEFEYVYAFSIYHTTDCPFIQKISNSMIKLTWDMFFFLWCCHPCVLDNCFTGQNYMHYRMSLARETRNNFLNVDFNMFPV